MNLTKNSDFVMRQLYKVFEERVANGTSVAHAKIFAEAELIHSKYFSQMSFDDFVDSIRELSKNELVNCSWDDYVFSEMVLKDNFISAVEKES